MTLKTNKDKIEYFLNLLVSFFNPKKVKNKSYHLQFIFNENDGVYKYYLSIGNNKCTVKKGTAYKSKLGVETDLKTMLEISGNYITGYKAYKQGRFKVTGSIFSFYFLFRRVFVGKKEHSIPEKRYNSQVKIDKIKRVLILSCSPRANKGATHLMAEKIVSGMKKSGAKVDVLFPAKMKIYPCKGCFKCWLLDEPKCVLNDDMKIFWEKYYKSDLIFWVTPVYINSGTSIMKILMDRLFVRSDPHIILVNNKYQAHPRKLRHLPYYGILAISAFSDKTTFKPLKEIMRAHCRQEGIKLITEFYRSSCMLFLIENLPIKTKDTILESLEKAGEEIIKYNKVMKKTKKEIERQIFPLPIFMSAANYHMDLMLEKKKLIFEREL